MTIASDAIARLTKSAQQRQLDSRWGKARVAVQVSHCSQSVGAAEVAQAVADALRLFDPHPLPFGQRPAVVVGTLRFDAHDGGPGLAAIETAAAW